MFRLLPVLALALAYLTLRIPFETYITDPHRDLLGTLIAANIFAYVMVTLNTIRITLEVVRREKAKSYVPARWAEHLIMSKWYTAVRAALKWHLLAAGARIGLAVGLAQHIHAVTGQPEDFQGILSPFFYASRDWGVDYKVPPQDITICIGVVLLCAFALSETGLLVALTQFTYGIFKRHTLKAAVATVVLRALLVLMLAGGMFAFRSAFKDYEYQAKSGNIYAESPLNDVKHALKFAHRPLFALLDNGTLLATEIMRPVGIFSWFSCTTLDYSSEMGGTICREYDNRPHVLTWLFLSAVALSFYAGLTWFFLRAAMRLNRRAISSPV